MTTKRGALQATPRSLGTCVTIYGADWRLGG